MVGVEGIFVFLLYILLVYDVIEAIRGPKRRVTERKTSHYVRPRPAHGLPSQRRCGSFAVDNLWRKMKQATDNVNNYGVTNDVITQRMADARVQQGQRTLNQHRIANYIDVS